MDYIVTVCDACLRASCWHGEFPCENYISAGTKEVLASSLKDNGEHESYYAPERLFKITGDTKYLDIKSI